MLVVVSAVQGMSWDFEDFRGQCARASSAVLEVGETTAPRLIRSPTAAVLASGIESRLGMQIRSELNLNSPDLLQFRSQREFAANSTRNSQYCEFGANLHCEFAGDSKMIARAPSFLRIKT